MKKKSILIIAIIILLIILLFPFQIRRLNDGGTVEYKALLYNVTKYHKLAPVANNSYTDGIGIKILGVEIYNNTNEEAIKLKDEKQEKQNQTNTTSQIHNNFVGTVLEETTTYMIVEPNQDEEERKTADKIKINYGTNHIDYLYGIGRKVIINYTGYIMETYPAQINTDNILINGYEDFKLTVETTTNKKKKKILNNTELYKNNSNYNLYYYGLSKVDITVDNKTMSLEEALRSGKMTLDGLIIKANKDFPKAISYDDGGSIEYHYDSYTIIKLHKLDGNRDVYIGTPEMKIQDLNI